MIVTAVSSCVPPAAFPLFLSAACFEIFGVNILMLKIGANVFTPIERPTVQCANYLSVYQGALAADSSLIALDSSDMVRSRFSSSHLRLYHH